ncbi:MAG TPA: glycosyltransferase family 2 protein [Nostocaceae cyanobacterium]|nr:glycosyltransferase family 2 protein [Nostocaceae cyanobacterium]
MLVSICVITFQRNDGLKRLLEGLNQLTFNKCQIPKIEVVVVDNDANGTAHLVCEEIKPEFRWPLQYYIETQRGISYARNKAIACTNPEASFILWIDDDEVPQPSWLDELLYMQEQTQADVVWGAVLPYFPDKNVPNWVIEGKFFDPPNYNNGQVVNLAATNNTLSRTEIFKKLDKFFDERFALTGGSDTHFFWRVHKMGFKIVWAKAAIVNEWIPQSRTKLKWVFQRSYRSGIIYSVCEREFESNFQRQIIRFIKGVVLIIWGSVLVIPYLLAKRHIFIWNLLKIARGTGTISGLLGVMKYHEYKQVHKV